jgi:hypothetical protein
MSATAAFSDIERMLQSCAKGHSIRLANHSYVIKYNNLVYRSLPKFKNIELGHVRKMVRHLGIEWDCAEKFGVV